MMLNRHPGNSKRWNIFARELEALLAIRRARIEALPEEIGLFPDTARRLVQSLSKPDLFPVLNAEEIEALNHKYRLTPDEDLRLNAATIAASLEETLIAYLDQETALSIADSEFLQILAALRQAEEGAKDTRRGDTFQVGDNTNDRAFNAALHSFDVGEKAMHRCLNARSQEAQRDAAHSAYESFQQALKHLDKADEHIRRTQGWRDWQAKIRHRLNAARDYL